MVQGTPSLSASPGPRVALALSTALLCLFALRAWRAAEQESATWDETGHFLAGYTALKLDDFRLDTEHPALWRMYAALPDLWAGPFLLDTSAESWRGEPSQRALARTFITDTLFHTPGNDTDRFLARARFMMLLLGIGLGALICGWAWRLGGPTAGVVATFFYSFDPNFLAHAPLVVNDVAVTLGYCGIMYATWRVGQRASAGRIVQLALVIALAVGAKFSALAGGPVFGLLLVLRALLDRPWIVLGREVPSRSARVRTAVVICGFATLVAYAGIWASYGFRYGPSPDPAIHTDRQYSLLAEASNELAREGSRQPTYEQLKAAQPSLLTRALLAIDERRVLPEAFIEGLLYFHARQIVRSTYFLGRTSDVGSWLYFPVAVLVKTPIGTLVAILTALGLLLSRRPLSSSAGGASARMWDSACLAVPPIIYFAAALAANLNIGVRHVLPIYPFLFVGVGVAGERIIRQRVAGARPVAAVLASALAVESMAASPDYLAFFNFSVGGTRSGLFLLGDSNLDWGQGWKLVARWQQTHPDEPLQYAYFGSGTPEHYGVRGTSVLGESGTGLSIRPEAGFLAISAHYLQRFNLTRLLEPTEVLGRSIYLFKTADFAAALKARSSATR